MKIKKKTKKKQAEPGGQDEGPINMLNLHEI